MLMNHYGRYGDFDLSTFLQDAVRTVNSVINPTPKPPATQQMQVIGTSQASPMSLPLFTVGGFQVTPTRALVGAVAIGAVIYFANKKKRR